MKRIGLDIYNNVVEFLRTFGAFQLFFLRLLRYTPALLFGRFGVKSHHREFVLACGQSKMYSAGRRFVRSVRCNRL